MEAELRTVIEVVGWAAVWSGATLAALGIAWSEKKRRPLRGQQQGKEAAATILQGEAWG